MQIVEFEPEHVKTLEVQPEQAHIRDLMIENAGIMGQYGPTVSWIDDGKVLGCAGAILSDPVIVWAILSEMGPHRFLLIHRHLLRILNARNEYCLLQVQEDFANGHRWAHLLGFKQKDTFMHERGFRCVQYERHKK